MSKQNEGRMMELEILSNEAIQSAMLDMPAGSIAPLLRILLPAQAKFTAKQIVEMVQEDGYSELEVGTIRSLAADGEPPFGMGFIVSASCWKEIKKLAGVER